MVLQIHPRKGAPRKLLTADLNATVSYLLF